MRFLGQNAAAIAGNTRSNPYVVVPALRYLIGDDHDSELSANRAARSTAYN
jgi:hypothetical protein